MQEAMGKVMRGAEMTMQMPSYYGTKSTSFAWKTGIKNREEQLLGPLYRLEGA